MARPRRKAQRNIRSLRDLDFSESAFSLTDETKRRIATVSIFALGIISFFSLVDLAGTAGVYLDQLLRWGFGAIRWLFPILLFGVGYALLRPGRFRLHFTTYLGLILLFGGFNGLVHTLWYGTELFTAAQAGAGGGFLGAGFAYPFVTLMGFWASLVTLLAVALIGFFLAFNSFFDSFAAEREAQEAPITSLGRVREWFANRRIQRYEESRGRTGGQELENIDPADAEFVRREVEVVKSPAANDAESAEAGEDEEYIPEPASVLASAVNTEHQVRKFKPVKLDLPVDLLDGKIGTPSGGDLKANRLIIQRTLKQFGIEADMGDSQVGPTVTQYTLKPAAGVRLSKIVGLSDNLALALAAHPIRIEAPIPGRSLVGIEVPNQATAIVPLRQVIDSDAFRNRKCNLMIGLGVDVMGTAQLADLTRMPHLLIAGATGSGKSVCINSLIVSLLYQNGPADLKFIMVDPKRVELPVYNGIPHLLTPVITNVKQTINALRWAINEMEQRFELLAAAHKRNIESYNAGAKQPIPYIVIIIDELADLMASSAAEVEGAIVRLAQMARAVGIHLVLATQRPSVDVITGLIKANVPARIAFSVASLVDSRTILDSSGAEKLLGRGDMLFLSAELSKPRRLQGAYASDDEIKRVIDHLKTQAEPEYVDEVVEKQAPAGSSGDSSESGEDDDPLLPDAKEVIFRAKKASASLLQRRLRVGYARAARLLDLLEAQGCIGPGDGAKPRDVLMKSLENATISRSNGGPVSSQSPDEIEQIDDSESDQDDDQSDDGDEISAAGGEEVEIEYGTNLAEEPPEYLEEDGEVRENDPTR